jgi:hypothetical protein
MIPLTITTNVPGLNLGYVVLGLDRTVFAPFSTAGMVEVGNGVYAVAGGVNVPTAGGYVQVYTHDGGYPDGIIGETAVEGIDNRGSGTGHYSDTITDGASPLDGVRVQLSTDPAGAHRVYETWTDALGTFTLRPDPGTYYRFLDLAGYTFAQGVPVEIT